MPNRWTWMGAVVIVMLSMTTAAWADEAKPGPLVISPLVIQQAIAGPPMRLAVPRQRASRTSSGKRAGWTVLGAVGGFFGGAFLGSAIDRATHDCRCDDPGLIGFFIGMPAGAIVGGIAGFVLAK
ncbi:MAG TPA: hypothetical protein VL173_03290 [Vicinamibacterales bacterium]|nr:hypothetical protein [Vicinamibacterales bacterium]